ncbi:hypothetical protein AK812_SmicGene40963 [Symbiodinium microadriaticum]|uniref:Uncharacterized protein n=1 Tax=Symbiodinium microadriaticum TaxID=2951 RepID=A0A1Q9C7C6_SYMMI|nr:hypothetical protein AK812_SmicGene40963 [Symbiodinium microadriaticum]
MVLVLVMVLAPVVVVLVYDGTSNGHNDIANTRSGGSSAPSLASFSEGQQSPLLAAIRREVEVGKIRYDGTSNGHNDIANTRSGGSSAPSLASFSEGQQSPLLAAIRREVEALEDRLLLRITRLERQSLDTSATSALRFPPCFAAAFPTAMAVLVLVLVLQLRGFFAALPGGCGGSGLAMMQTKALVDRTQDGALIYRAKAAVKVQGDSRISTTRMSLDPEDDVDFKEGQSEIGSLAAKHYGMLLERRTGATHVLAVQFRGVMYCHQTDVKGMLVVNEQLGDEMVLAESCVKIRTPDLISDISLSFVLGLDLAELTPSLLAVLRLRAASVADEDRRGLCNDMLDEAVAAAALEPAGCSIVPPTDEDRDTARSPVDSIRLTVGIWSAVDHFKASPPNVTGGITVLGSTLLQALNLILTEEGNVTSLSSAVSQAFQDFESNFRGIRADLASFAEAATAVVDVPAASAAALLAMQLRGAGGSAKSKRQDGARALRVMDRAVGLTVRDIQVRDGDAAE